MDTLVHANLDVIALVITEDNGDRVVTLFAPNDDRVASEQL
jgi:hypothetical protein